MIMTEYTSSRGGAAIDELLIISGEPPVRSDIGAIKTGIRVYRTPDSADKGRVSKTRERIVGAICRSAFGFGIEDLEARYDRTLAKFPALAPAVRRIYDRTSYSTGIYESGSCEDPHERGFERVATERRSP